jgi:hypothetical protein
MVCGSLGGNAPFGGGVLTTERPGRGKRRSISDDMTPAANPFTGMLAGDPWDDTYDSCR